MAHPTAAWTSNQRASMETKSNSRSLRAHPKKRQERILDAREYARRIPKAKQQRLLRKCHSQWDVTITTRSMKRPNSLPCILFIFHLVKIQFTRHHPINDVCGKIRHIRRYCGHSWQAKSRFRSINTIPANIAFSITLIRNIVP